MIKFALLSAFVLAGTVQVFATGTWHPVKLAGGHTAGVIQREHICVDIDVYPASNMSGNGLLFGVGVGVTHRFSLGLSYGGEGIIGYGSQVSGNAYPGVMLKYRLFEETHAGPALAIGFDNNGYGGPATEGEFGYNGYIYKSPGFFIAISKNYIMLNAIQIGYHGQINYSMEDLDVVNWPNVLAGMDIGFGDKIMFLIEYDFAFNDLTGDSDKYFIAHCGFLNIGVRWVFSENFHIEFNVKDILGNKERIINPLSPEAKYPIGWSRGLKITYIAKI